MDLDYFGPNILKEAENNCFFKVVVELSNIKLKITQGRFKKKQKMVGFIQRSSDPSQPGRALDKKNQKLHNLFMSVLSL